MFQILCFHIVNFFWRCVTDTNIATGLYLRKKHVVCFCPSGRNVVGIWQSVRYVEPVLFVVGLVVVLCLVAGVACFLVVGLLPFPWVEHPTARV